MRYDARIAFMLRVTGHPGVRIVTLPFYFTAVTVSGALLVRTV
jgi:hypothetical protein